MAAVRYAPAGCLSLKVFQSVEVRRPVCAALASMKSEEVAIADGTPAPIVPRTELAAMVARPMVAFVPPTSAPAPAERVRPLLPVRVVVATFPSFAGVAPVVVQYASCPAVSADEVATAADPPTPLASVPSHRSALPVNSAQVMPANVPSAFQRTRALSAKADEVARS